MKALLFIAVLTFTLVSCSTNEDKEEQFCGNVTATGHGYNTDYVTITNGSESRRFEVSNYMDYPLHSYRCK